MSSWIESWAGPLVAALEPRAAVLTQTAPGRWSFAPAGAAELRADISLGDDWLLFDAPLPEPASRLSAWDAFAVNAELPGALKLCSGAAGGLRLRAEHPLQDQECLPGAVRDVCAALCAAAAGFGNAVLASAAAPESTHPASVADTDVARLLAEAGWAFTPRGGDTAMVELDVPGIFQQATVTTRPGGGVSASVPVLLGPPRTASCAHAVGAFLLRLTGAVRMVRAARGAEPVPVRLEVARAAAAPFAAVELGHALAALSLAWRWAGRETAALAADERVADSFVGAASADAETSTPDLSTPDFSTTACG